MTVLSRALDLLSVQEESYFKNPIAISLLLAVLAAVVCAWKLNHYFGPFPLEAEPYNRYAIFAESILHGTLETAVTDAKFHENLDPYEPNGRVGGFLWDYSYYKGKQYHYVSFLPSLLFVIPFRYIFGFYPSEQVQLIGSCFFTVFAISLLSCTFLSIFAPIKPPFDRYIFRYPLLLFCLCGSGLFLAFADDSDYTIPPYQGVAFMSFALLFLFRARLANNTLDWTAASLFYILAVASRPTLLLYAPVFVAVALTFDGLRRKIQTLTILSMFLAFCAIALGTMNYVRFENAFEFGNRFQLNQFNNFKYPFIPNSWDLFLQRVPRGLWFHLVKPPRLFIHDPYLFISLYTPPWVLSFTKTPVGGDGMIGTLVFLPALVLSIPRTLMAGIRLSDWRATCIAVLMICSLMMLAVQTTFTWVADRYALDYRLYLTLSCVFATFVVFPGPKDAKAEWHLRAQILSFYGFSLWTVFLSSLALFVRYQHG